MKKFLAGLGVAAVATVLGSVVCAFAGLTLWAAPVVGAGFLVAMANMAD